MYRAYYKSEVGLLEVTANEKGITSILFVEEQGEENPNVVVEQCIAELDEYFNQKRTVFSVPLSAEGTAFQKKVWEALLYHSIRNERFIFRYCKKNWEPKSCASNRWSE